MGKMPAGIAKSLGKWFCEEISIPAIQPGKVLVKTNMSSICGSDLHITYMGWNVSSFPLPHGYPGHEGIGEVIDGGDTEYVPGELVLTVPNIWQSKCFAEYQLIDTQFLLRMPKTMPESHLLMAQQLGTVVFGCKRLPSLIGKTVAIIGQGSVGLFHDFMLRKIGAHKIIGIEPIPERLNAGKNLGIDHAIDVTGDRATEAVLDLTNGEGADLVIEAVGSTETLNQSLKMVRLFGQIAVFGLPPSADKILFDWDTFFRKCARMHTVFRGQDEPGLPAFKLAVDYIKNGEIDMSPFVTHTFPIWDIQEAFDLANERSDGALKVSLTF
jgi:L-iditol 2-dehydrogenase